MRAFIIVFITLFAAPLLAQVQQASVEGRVTDTDGLAVAGASVELLDPATNQSWRTTTDAAGAFRLSVPPSDYDLHVEHAAFNPYSERGLHLLVGRTMQLTIPLAASTVSESMEVVARRSPLDTAETSATSVIDTERIEELPVRSRNYLEFVLLAPGVVSTGGIPAASVVRDSGFSFAGMRPRSNMLTIDGLDNNDEVSGSARTELSLESVKEFEVVSSGWSADNGGAAGGTINVVTRSGTNTMHGDAFVFGQPGRSRRGRAGGAAGGPIARDRTFYYTAMEQERGRGEDDARIATSRSETEMSAKINHQVTPRDSLVMRFALTRSADRGDAFNTSTLFDASSRGSEATRDATLTASWTMIVGNNTTNDVRAQLAERHVAVNTADDRGPGIVIAGVAEFGRPYAGNARHRQRYAQLGDTFTVARGSHFLRAGADVMRVDVSGENGDGFGGVYAFSSLDAFTRQQPDSFRRVFGDRNFDLRATRYGAFIHDQWTRASLTLDAGARLDSLNLPHSLGITNRQITPRFGVAWTPAPRWVIRGGAGVFADRIPLAAFERPLVVDGTNAFEQIVDGATAAALFVANGGAAPATPLPGVVHSIYTVRDGSWTPSSRQASIGVEHLVAAQLTASANVVVARGRHLLRTVKTGDAFEVQPTASSSYRGLTISVNQRLADDAEWSAAYTLSKATDDASDYDEQPANPRALPEEWGPSRFDQRHRFVASARFEVEGQRIEIAPILEIESGRPANITTGIFPSARPAGVPRNSLRLPATASLNLRVLKYVPVRPHGRLDFVIQAFNLLNRRNVVQINSVWGAPSFRRPIETSPRRQLEFSVDLEF